MNKQTLEYIASRANESDTGSIKAVSCPDIRALLDERAALLAALESLENITNDPAFQRAATKSGYMAQFSTAKDAARRAIRQAQE